MSEITTRPMTAEDWPYVSKIYLEGIATEHATFQTTCPPYTAWDASHTKDCRLVVLDDGVVAGWAALHRVDPRWCYRGVGARSSGAGASASTCSRLCATLPMRLATGPCNPPYCRTTRPAAACTPSAASVWWGGGNALPATAMAAGWTRS